uniref:Uncharacterized protein n=2 Tax=Vitrella brassicaformis TaxID=1169539 RepID=A0A7S1KCV1_9ALVE|mmetsp:Transcript_48433/g.121254  ORF Transcript_48433/g.121254 Transcript_48433/m.121254 type:complete len:182 (+) Transcript_48433:122-667(+)
MTVMASKYAVLIALATVSAVVVDSATRKGDCVGKDCDTDLSGASFVGRSGEISHLETTCTHSKTGALSFAQQQVQQAKTMMVAANKMSQATKQMAASVEEMAASALDAIHTAEQQMKAITKKQRGNTDGGSPCSQFDHDCEGVKGLTYCGSYKYKLPPRPGQFMTWEVDSCICKDGKCKPI